MLEPKTAYKHINLLLVGALDQIIGSDSASRLWADKCTLSLQETQTTSQKSKNTHY